MGRFNDNLKNYKKLYSEVSKQLKIFEINYHKLLSNHQLIFILMISHMDIQIHG